MKTIYSVQMTMKCESNSIFTSDNETEARKFFDNEAQKLSANTPADVTGWSDGDRAWSDVYFVELIKTTVDDDDYLLDCDTLASTDYFYL